MLPPAYPLHCSTLAVATTWTQTTANAYKFSAKAPKVLGWEMGVEYGQTYTNSEGGTQTNTFTTTVINTVAAVVTPCVHVLLLLELSMPSGPAAACCCSLAACCQLMCRVCHSSAAMQGEHTL